MIQKSNVVVQLRVSCEAVFGDTREVANRSPSSNASVQAVVFGQILGQIEGGIEVAPDNVNASDGVAVGDVAD